MQLRRKKSREIDQLSRTVFFSISDNLAYVSKKRVKTWQAVSVFVFTLGLAIGTVFLVRNNLEDRTKAESISDLMGSIKKRGCVADGLLTGSGGDTESAIKLMERSECVYLHRAIESWVVPPDFALAQKNMGKFKKGGLIFGMFISEAIGVNAEYYYPAEKRNFDFSAMCREKSRGFWGEGTCKAYFGSPEYRKYLSYITQRAIDLDVKSFLFGQIFFQDNGQLSKSWASEIVGEIRKYAKSKGKRIVVGAQTNNITDKKYLKIFDYIEGGVGIDDQGNIENGPCWSRWWKKKGDRCWALLWHDDYAKKADNVILHLDWSGLDYDDMSRFARMDKKTRVRTLQNLYKYFTAKNMGFLMPYLAVIYKDNNGCYGPNKEYYSPDNKYSCKDEDEITAIFRNAQIKNDAVFMGQSVPTSMISGQEYQISVTVKNTGTETWTDGKGYRLGSQNPQDNNIWRSRIYLEADETVEPGKNKVFSFLVKAPAPGTYNFQWQMLE